MSDFEDNTKCFYLSFNQVQPMKETLFHVAECPPRYFANLLAVTEFHLSTEALMGIGD